MEHQALHLPKLLHNLLLPLLGYGLAELAAKVAILKVVKVHVLYLGTTKTRSMGFGNALILQVRSVTWNPCLSIPFPIERLAINDSASLWNILDCGLGFTTITGFTNLFRHLGSAADTDTSENKLFQKCCRH